MSNKYFWAIVTMTLLLFACGDEEQLIYDCADLQLNIGDVCPTIDPSIDSLVRETFGIVTEDCLCLADNTFDCPATESNIGDECRSTTGIGRIDENCVCQTEDDLPVDCAEFGSECRDDRGVVGVFDFACQCNNLAIETRAEVDSTAFMIELAGYRDALLTFEVIPLSTGHATRVQPSERVEILDSSTFGYPDALISGETISESNTWAQDGPFVLGTSVGNAGNFEGAGLRYLGFRIQLNNQWYYGWVSLDNNIGNTSLFIIEHGLNFNAGEPAIAGE